MVPPLGMHPGGQRGYPVGGGKSMADRAAERLQQILETHQPEPIDQALAQEIDGIVESARRNLL